jgi:cytosine/adenosine deaminase-related metal-dependent hydrolase
MKNFTTRFSYFYKALAPLPHKSVRAGKVKSFYKMHFKKLQADLLFDGYHFLENKVLVLTENGVVEDIIEPDQAGTDVETVGGMLLPGFINCHCHLELSHLQGHIEENTGLPDFVRQVVQKRNFSEADILAAIETAEASMLRNGIVAVGDISNTLHSLAQKQKKNIYYHNFIEAMGFNPQLADPSFTSYQLIYNQFAAQFGPRQVSITPHAPYSVSQPLWQKIIAHDANGLLSIHNQETLEETLWFQQKTGGFTHMFKAMGLNTDSFIPSGKTSLQTYFHHFLPQQQVLLVHNVYTTEEDIAFIHETGNKVFWCLCPNANHYINRTLPNLAMFIKNNASLVLGTDSLASNHQLSIWEEIQTLRKAYEDVPLASMLQWATSNGAKALKIDAQYGSFEKGKQPGVVQVLDNTVRSIY